MERENNIRKPYFLVWMWLLIACISIGGITFAWFNFRSSTNVEPNTGSTISEGDLNLLIANNPGGPFEKTTNLVLSSHAEVLTPVSTNSLNSFYASAAQNTDGITILYSDVTADVDRCVLRGSVYLKAERGNQKTGGGSSKGKDESLDVYFAKPMMDFGSNVQAGAALRLGLKITSDRGSDTYIFRLDDMMDVSGAESKVTITSPGNVVASISQGAANYAPDEARDIDDFCAVVSGPEDTDPKAGANSLCTLSDGQVAQVEYWLYLEGCDENCINEVQSKDLVLALGFAGTDHNK